MNFAIEKVEKGTINYFAMKVSKCEQNLKTYFEAESNHILRIEGSIEKLVQRISNGSRLETSKRNNIFEPTSSKNPTLKDFS